MNSSEGIRFFNTNISKVLIINEDQEQNAILQVKDALLYGARYPGSRQIIFDKLHGYSFTSLECLIELSHKFQLLDKAIKNAHRIELKNGSKIELHFSGIDKNDLYTIMLRRYGGAEFNVVRFIEITNYTWRQLAYICSRLRGHNGYPLQLKLTSTHYKRQRDYIKDMFFDAFLRPNEEVQINQYNNAMFIFNETEEVPE
jgi:hypothetical protein